MKQLRRTVAVGRNTLDDAKTEPVQILLILNDPPYGTERCYNGLRLALTLAKSEPKPDITVFLMADAVAAAKTGQKTPDGYYNVERMLKGALAGKARILLCGTCMDARGLADIDIMAGARRSSMSELATATLASDKVLVF
jgi:uncharacterized protein involved in oxidation of intracellular sulfur